jgi:hypothetical protein
VRQRVCDSGSINFEFRRALSGRNRRVFCAAREVVSVGDGRDI